MAYLPISIKTEKKVKMESVDALRNTEKKMRTNMTINPMKYKINYTSIRTNTKKVMMIIERQIWIYR